MSEGRETELPLDLVISDEAVTDRALRRLPRALRQVEHRIAQIAALNAEREELVAQREHFRFELDRANAERAQLHAELERLRGLLARYTALRQHPIAKALIYPYRVFRRLRATVRVPHDRSSPRP